MRVGIKSAIIAVACVSAAGFYLSLMPLRPVASSTPFAKTATAKVIPEIRFQDDAGRVHMLADFRGKLVLLNIWATWCAPCREEMPALDRLRSMLAARDFEVLALSIDQQGATPVRNFFAEHGIKALQPYIDPTGSAGVSLGAFGVPTTLLIDPDGHEIGRYTGMAKWDSAEIVADLRRRLDAISKKHNQ